MTTQLTHAVAIKACKPGRYFDGRSGLHLWVKSPTQKYWIYRFQVSKKRQDMSLGVFPRMPLTEARKGALEARIILDKGMNPLEERARLKAAKAIESSHIPTFEKFAEAWIEMKHHEWRNSKHKDQWSNTLRDYAYPVIGSKALNNINTEDILEILSSIWISKTATATRLRGRIENILAAAKTRGFRSGLNPAQWKGHLDTLLSRPNKVSKVTHHPALPYETLPDFISKLRTHNCISAMALEFTILTCTRTSETLLAKRGEIQGDIWNIPGCRMKSGKSHRIPLPFRAIQLYKLACKLDQDSDYIFSRNKKPLSNMAMLTLLRRVKPGMTVHGFRSTFRDWVSEDTHHSPELAEMALAHTITSRVEAAYRRGDLLEKRRSLMSDWETYCQSVICKETNVEVGLKSA